MTCTATSPGSVACCCSHAIRVCVDGSFYCKNHVKPCALKQCNLKCFRTSSYCKWHKPRSVYLSDIKEFMRICGNHRVKLFHGNTIDSLFLAFVRYKHSIMHWNEDRIINLTRYLTGAVEFMVHNHQICENLVQEEVKVLAVEFI